MRRLLLSLTLALGVFGVSAASARRSTPCTGPLGAVTIKGHVSAGPGCDLSGTTVEGSVTVNPGGSLFTEFESKTAITGNLTSTKATEISLDAGSIGGKLQLNGTTQGIEIRHVTVEGNSEITNGVPNVFLGGDTIGGNLQIHRTTGCSQVDLLGLLIVSVGGNVEIGDNSLECPFTNVVSVDLVMSGGNLRVSNNTLRNSSEDRVTVQSNGVGRNLEVSNNTSHETKVIENHVSNILNCQDNEPPALDRGFENTARQKQGECEHL